MTLLCTAIFLFLLFGASSEYMPPLTEILDNAQFRELLVSLSHCRSQLYVCAYGLTECMERTRGPSDPPSETVLKETVERWSDAQDDDLCDKSLDECKQKYFACDVTAPDLEKVVEEAKIKHAEDLADLEPSAKIKHYLLEDEDGDDLQKVGPKPPVSRAPKSRTEAGKCYRLPPWSVNVCAVR